MAQQTGATHDMPKVQDPILEQAKTETRFWIKVDKRDGCWLWRGPLHRGGLGNGGGYGRFYTKGLTVRREFYAHRIAYELLNGPIPLGLTIDHLCRNRGCVNPAHMEIVSVAINVLRGIGPAAQHAIVIHCPKGHPYDLLNTIWEGNGWRKCRECRRAYDRKRNQLPHRRIR